MRLARRRPAGTPVLLWDFSWQGHGGFCRRL